MQTENVIRIEHTVEAWTGTTFTQSFLDSWVGTTVKLTVSAHPEGECKVVAAQVADDGRAARLTLEVPTVIAASARERVIDRFTLTDVDRNGEPAGIIEESHFETPGVVTGDQR